MWTGRRSPAAANRPYPSSSNRSSFRLDAGGLDDRPPFLDLGLVVRGQALRRLLLPRRDIEAQLGESRAHGGIRERLHHRRIELRDDVLRRAFGREKPEPSRKIEPGYAGLVRGG